MSRSNNAEERLRSCISLSREITGGIKLRFRTGVPNLSLTMYRLSIPTDEHVPLNSLVTKRLSRMTKILNL